MSRIGKSPIPVPCGVDVSHRRPARHREGPQGHPRARHPRRHHRPPGRRHARSSSAPTTSARTGPCTAWSARSSTTWSLGVTEGFRKELEIVGVGYRATAKGPARSSWPSASATRSTSTPPTASPSRCPRPTRIVVSGHRQGAGRPGGRRHPSDPQARALQGQGRPLPGRARRAARPARPASSRTTMSMSTTPSRSATPASGVTAGCARRCAGTAERPRLAVFRSNKHIVGPGHRRPRRPHPRRRPRPSRPTCAPARTGNVDAAAKVGQLVAERAKAAGVDHGRVRPRRLPLPRPRRGPGRRRPRSRTGVLMAR